MHKSYLLILTVLISIKSLALALFILYGEVGLGPDEAQYWVWSRFLDWGYYSKPPGIAWEIALGTFLFGNTEFGVRSMPLFIGGVLPYAVYWMANRCHLKPQICFWAAVCMAFCPIGVLSSFLAITDGGMVLFWSLVCVYCVGKIEQREVPNYFLIGVLVCCGALFKWPIYSLWVFILASWMFFPFLRSWCILLGMAVSLMALLPSLYWNIFHDWATFRHVFATLAGGHAPSKQGVFLSGNPLEFIGAQALLVSPILFILLVMAWKELMGRKHLPYGVLFCGALSLACFAFGAVMALFMKIQGNWVIFAYPPAFVFLGWSVFGESSWKKKGVIAGVVFSVIATVAVFSIPFFQAHSIASLSPISYKVNPFRHNVGWKNLEVALKESGYNPRDDFLFSDKYQTASILSFYGPDQKRAYFFNLQGCRKNQFSYWPGMEIEQKGKKGFFAVIENVPQLNHSQLQERYLEALKPYFESVQFIGNKSLFKAYGDIVKGILLFECIDYKGELPLESELY